MATMKAFLSEVLDGLAVDHAEIRIEESEQATVLYRGKQLDELSRSFERGGCIRVFHRGNWGVATFNDIDEELRGLAREVAAQVTELPAGEGALTPLPALDETVRVAEEDDPRKVSLGDKHRLIQHYNNIMLKTPGVATTTAMYRDQHRYVALYSSDGRYVDQEFAHTGFMCQAVAKDGTNIQDYGDGFGKTRGFESLRDKEALVETVAKRAVDLLKAEPVDAGRYDVVIDQLLAGVFVHEAFGHLSEADHIFENERLREMMAVGTRFGTEALTIVDDATMAGERGTFAYDDEGTAGDRTELVRHGVLVNHLHDRQTANRMNEAPTGNGRALSYRFPPIVRMTNTYIEPRETQLEDMLESMERGLYVVGSRGGMTELESFTFSAKYAWLIEHGRRTKLLRNVTLSGNVFETMHNIVDIGDDLTMFGGLGGCGKHGQAPLPVGLGAPHVKIRNVVIGGR